MDRKNELNIIIKGLRSDIYTSSQSIYISDEKDKGIITGIKNKCIELENSIDEYNQIRLLEKRQRDIKRNNLINDDGN